MKKMIAAYLISIAFFGVFGFFIGGALSLSGKDEALKEQARAHEAEITALKDEISAQEELLKHKSSAISILEQKKSVLENQIELLDELIANTKTSDEKDKLLKERIPYGMTNTIRFMDYRKITDKNSIQYKLQQECRTEQGIRYYDKYICTALGSAYGQDIGDTWHVTLHCGTEFDIILAEFKDDGKTDFFGHPDENYDKQDCINILEFVVDENKMSYVAKKAGTYTALGYYGGLYGNGGNVAKMEYTGRVWSL